MLDLHRDLGRDELPRTIEVGTELDPLLTDPAQLAQAEDLVSATVGEHRPLPRDKTVEAAHGLHRLRPGAQEEMVGVSQNDPRVELFEHLLGERLDRPLGADRHEDRGLDLAMCGADQPTAGRAPGIYVEQLE